MSETFLIAILCLVAGGALAVLALRLRPQPAAGPDPALERLAELSRVQSEASGHMRALGDMLASKQAELQMAVNERLDSLSHRLGQSLQSSAQCTTENLQKLNERLAVIDGAQKNITALATQVTSLQSVLANKQQRGAFGQSRMEIIIQDGLPKGCYEFQYTLSNKTRPDCAIFLPDKRPLLIDAKFPLEAVTAYREAKSDDERARAATRLRQDFGKHVADIAAKYLIPGETQDLALMFVPSESIYSELYDGFDDVFQKAFRSRVMIISPSLLMLAIQVVQQIQKDARLRDAADKIHAEVGHLMDDLRRLQERVGKLKSHFGQANDDLKALEVSAEKIEKRGSRICDVDFGEDSVSEATVLAAPAPRRLRAGE